MHLGVNQKFIHPSARKFKIWQLSSIFLNYSCFFPFFLLFSLHLFSLLLKMLKIDLKCFLGCFTYRDLLPLGPGGWALHVRAPPPTPPPGLRPWPRTPARDLLVRLQDTGTRCQKSTTKVQINQLIWLIQVYLIGNLKP